LSCYPARAFGPACEEFSVRPRPGGPRPELPRLDVQVRLLAGALSGCARAERARAAEVDRSERRTR
jgi:hypothetical protein